MWHDDEGDESPGSGERPDPSTRHWRHPSELGQQGALPHPDRTPITVTTPANATTMWPLVAVGGCLAIAALGVIGFRTDLGRADSLQAGSAATVAAPPTTFRTAAAAAASEDTVAGTTSTPAGHRPGSTDGDDHSTLAEETTSLPEPGRPTQTSAPLAPEGKGARSNDLLEATPLTPPAEEAPVYGVYAAPGRDQGQLGSFLVIDGAPVTSASSLGGRSTVWLRVETRWLEATLVATDPITDVALLDIVDDLGDGTMPDLVVATEPLGIGAPAMVGYGDPDLTIDGQLEDLSGAGDGWNGEVGNDATASNLGHSRSTITAARPQRPPGDDAVRRWVAGSDRRGVIYSLTKPLVTGSGRLINDPIRLTTTPGPTDAGGPVRNRDGEIIGLVADSPLPQVAAVPIDRVVAAIGWLGQRGIGDPSWLGLTVVSQPGGLVITAVDETGPATDLAPGDLIIAVDRQPVFHPDSLTYAARQAGPGQILQLTIDRQNRRSTVAIEVGTVPLR